MCPVQTMTEQLQASARCICLFQLWGLIKQGWKCKGECSTVCPACCYRWTTNVSTGGSPMLLQVDHQCCYRWTTSVVTGRPPVLLQVDHQCCCRWTINVVTGRQPHERLHYQMYSNSFGPFTVSVISKYTLIFLALSLYLLGPDVHQPF